MYIKCSVRSSLCCSGSADLDLWSWGGTGGLVSCAGRRDGSLVHLLDSLLIVRLGGGIVIPNVSHAVVLYRYRSPCVEGSNELRKEN